MDKLQLQSSQRQRNLKKNNCVSVSKMKLKKQQRKETTHKLYKINFNFI